MQFSGTVLSKSYQIEA